MKGPAFDWASLVPRFVNPTQVIIIEAMLYIDRPLSATELEKLASGNPALSTFSYHLKRLKTLGVVNVVGKLKVRKSTSSHKETFFYFGNDRGWVSRLADLDDPADPLTAVALSVAAS